MWDLLYFLFILFLFILAACVAILIYNVHPLRSSSHHCGDGVYGPCFAQIDSRGFGGLCTYHCATITRCNGRCLSVWDHEGAARDIAKKLLARAK